MSLEPPAPAPSIISVRAPLDAVRSALAGIGAVGQERRSVALDLGDHLLLLAYDPDEMVTAVAVGGDRGFSTATWLAHELAGIGFVIEYVLPPIAEATA